MIDDCVICEWYSAEIYSTQLGCVDLCHAQVNIWCERLCQLGCGRTPVIRPKCRPNEDYRHFRTTPHCCCISLLIYRTLHIFTIENKFADLYTTHTLRHNYMESKLNKRNAELQRTDPGTKVTGEFNTKGRIFPPNVWNEFLLFPSF